MSFGITDNCTLYEANELEKIQLEAAHIATGSTKLVSIDSLYTETGWFVDRNWLGNSSIAQEQT